MLSTLFLVMTGLSDGTDRASVNAFTAGPLGEKEAVSPMIGIGSRCGCNGYLGDDRPCPQGFPFLGDQSVAQAEGPQTGRMGGMALRPG